MFYDNSHRQLKKINGSIKNLGVSIIASNKEKEKFYRKMNNICNALYKAFLLLLLILIIVSLISIINTARY
jgi:hypothetical protein